MLLESQIEEQERRFKLALRAGIPVLILTLLVSFIIFAKNRSFAITPVDLSLLTSVTFITIYFIYFFMNVSVQETIIDQTTQSFNKNAFIKKLQDCRPKSLICIKVENLSSLNENYSSTQTDNLLRVIPKQIDNAFAKDKVVIGRYYGGEFLIALNHNNYIEETIKDIIEDIQIVDNMEVDYKFAIITNVQDDFEQELVQLRDIIASQSVACHNHSESSNIKDAQEVSKIEKDIVSSLKSKNLILSFRPLFDNYVDDINIYEISVKLKSKSNSYILPRVFLPIINRLGLGRDYDLILAKRVIDILTLVDDNISFSFNLSPFSLRDSSFQEKFFDYLKEKKVNPSRLIIQLYERKTHHNLSRYLETLSTFRREGIKICIDNFGSSNNASMEYMKHFKFDMVQFDRDYVTNLDDTRTYTMLNSLIKLSKELNIKTIAKWVDTDEQKKRLKMLGVHYMQGFGISITLNEQELIDKYN